MEPIWMPTARKLIGTTEKPGTDDNPVIIKWADSLSDWVDDFYTDDSIPWCGLFVAHVMNVHKFKVPANPLGALKWSDWGQKLDKPSPGAIMTFTRKGGGHVGFYVSEDKDTYHILGGNQSDMVTITKIAKDRLDAIRWPPGEKLPKTGPVIAVLNGTISKNEA